MAFDRTVLFMAVLRFISALLIFSAAVLMLKYNSIPQALRLNAFLGLVGPLIMVSVSVLGIADLAGNISWAKIVITISGVILVLYGTAK
ncbi:YqhV family protein [Metallumcola ferriviriculae]|uniref:YqhV family protein n=1 Tax=Metallumcola ferriviriculae TaxID=3039180 RepID=A0AAU0UIP3_9FIRM|nr:YqhV family protein [Desulfitibacteraceae bacterium MK1]